MRKVAYGAVCGVLLLTGCVGFGQPSPTSTYTNDVGETVTVDWADYPAHARIDGQVLLDYPDQENLKPVTLELLRQLHTAISDTTGIELTPDSPESTWFEPLHWYPYDGNGYGGGSMLIAFNCCELMSGEVPPRSTWQEILDAVSEVTQDAGLGPLVPEHESPSVTSDPDSQERYRGNYCNMDGGECWMWSAIASDGAQSVQLMIEDRAADPTGEAARQVKGLRVPPPSISIWYSASVVREGKSDEFARAMAPFIGLERPAATADD